MKHQTHFKKPEIEVACCTSTDFSDGELDDLKLIKFAKKDLVKKPGLCFSSKTEGKQNGRGREDGVTKRKNLVTNNLYY